MKKVVVFILSLLIFNAVNAESEKALFSKCVDGDTAYFLVNENEIKVRFLAIDTPESVSTNVSEQPFGKEASDYTCNKISNADEIVLEYEKNKTDPCYFRMHPSRWPLCFHTYIRTDRK